MAIPSLFSLWPDHVLNHLAVDHKLMYGIFWLFFCQVLTVWPMSLSVATLVATVQNPLLGSLSLSYSLSHSPPFLPSFSLLSLPSKIYIILVHRNICLFSQISKYLSVHCLATPDNMVPDILHNLFHPVKPIPVYCTSKDTRYSAWLRSMFSGFPTYLDWKVG